jgi:hypothetical protein
VATIGFVSAGLLSFTASIGVIIGANVGTTSTGWIVSLLGLKLNVGAIALPLIGVGALLRLLSAGRRANLGMALAGFGLIFIGIDFLQEGMGGLAQRIDLAVFSTAALAGLGRGGAGRRRLYSPHLSAGLSGRRPAGASPFRGGGRRHHRSPGGAATGPPRAGRGHPVDAPPHPGTRLRRRRRLVRPQVPG